MPEFRQIGFELALQEQLALWEQGKGKKQGGKPPNRIIQQSDRRFCICPVERERTCFEAECPRKPKAED